MRRKISLYIDGHLADIDEQTFILFNYTMDDLSNPTIVRNSFSQQVTLPGTPNNDVIFGDSFRLDRRVDYNSGASGAGFNPSKKTDFSIYNELGEIVESGYCKLDEVVRRGGSVSYKISLFGGLGSFLYSLSYAEDGRKLTLADLDYLGNGDPAELDFTINASTISDAWDDLWDVYMGNDPGTIWKIINFAPAYNGYPDNFSPDKGLLSLPGAGLPDSVGGYSSKSGYGLVNMANKQDEWAVKDLRSYLQRPVLSFKAFLEAISNPDNNGGYQVDYSDLDNYLSPFPYTDLWLTLPTIPSLGSMKQTTGGLSVTMATSATTGHDLGTFSVSGAIPSGATLNAVLRAKLRFNMPAGADSYNTLYLNVGNGSGRWEGCAIFLQVVAYASDNTPMGASGVKMVGVRDGAKYAATACGFTPPYATDDYEWVDAGNASKITAGVFELDNEVTFLVEAQDVAYYKLYSYVYEAHSYRIRGRVEIQYSGSGNTSRAKLYHDYNTLFQADTALLSAGSGNSVTMTNPDALRSGARITKQMLLSTSRTPAEYLLSFCKIFGLYFVTDRASKSITILTRNALYTEYADDIIDLTERIDLSQDVSITPLVFDSKWYKFSLEGIGGAFFDEYKDVEGIDYGIQLVDTGYDFNAEVVDLLAGNVFKNAVTILQRSRYWNIITNGANFYPSPFVDTGNTITRWNASDETQDTPIPCPPSTSTITYYNATFNGYDINESFKVQFADADGKMVDGKDVLLYLTTFRHYDSFKVTDDLPVMSAVNNGVPCWILDEGAGLDIPQFSRFDGLSSYWLTLDFGVPRQLDIPGFTYTPQMTLYAITWKDYLTDRYDVNTKIMRCRVDLRGLDVNQELLRRFYYYDGCLWVLNKIINHSVTTFDLVECEFIQVQDKQNYTDNQFTILIPV